MVFSSLVLILEVVAFVTPALGQEWSYGPNPFPLPVAVPEILPPVTSTVTFTEFGPMHTFTIHSTVTQTQMFNGGITHDVRISDAKSVTLTFYNDNTEWEIKSCDSTLNSLVTKTLISEFTKNAGRSPDVTIVSTLLPTSTVYNFVNVRTQATHTLTYKSITQEISVVVIPMTTTLFQTITRTHVAVENFTVTSTRSALAEPVPATY